MGTGGGMMKTRILPILYLFMSTPLFAQSAPSEADDLIFEGGFVIEGEVQTPEVVVVIARGNLNKAYDFELKESFLNKIVEALDSPPF
jgi:hypothetical protein